MSINTHNNKNYTHIKCKVITVSDTRTEADDKSGKTIMELLEAAGHYTANYVIVKDEIKEIQTELLKNTEAQAIILNGGTGISPRDVTIEAVAPLLTKEISGFGELFRMISYTEDIGAAAMLSRAIAGTVGERAVFAMPGSTGAVMLGMKKLILPELSHVISELHKK
ncbi:MogA/MoaB family molybdenum cofactor biosynthesis protein [Bacillus sp. Au-Bac7]|uniref:MogA/MoaB family molybdenum cofactor biosynthesis protein n=1 Tax=Bacillus sp. Au-Bac7 TaxID=2906458 RepID=UPI001E2E7630|nr:MogA/MoaB family molybdenum cofactor biosynthesis protein [Bacillus sp. Au-Bac7]MCE4051176.1 MogA/MoaB family molybdenum cofactor biosynthesis protein [Bacillus sp. Au-Bac7]